MRSLPVAAVELVARGARVHGVVAGVAHELVAAEAAVERVVAVAARHLVVAGLAEELVVARPPDMVSRAVAPEELVVAVLAVHAGPPPRRRSMRSLLAAARERVASGAGADQVVAAVTEQAVGRAPAIDLVVGGVAGDRVLAAGARRSRAGTLRRASAAAPGLEQHPCCGQRKRAASRVSSVAGAHPCELGAGRCVPCADRARSTSSDLAAGLSPVGRRGPWLDARTRPAA